MRTSTLVVLLAIPMVFLGACGTSGGGPGGPVPGDDDDQPLPSINFYEGDASATLSDVTLTFGPPGSPVDGELLLLVTQSALFLQSLQELKDIQLTLLYLVTPSSTTFLDTAVALDYASRIQNPAAAVLVLELWWAVHENEIGQLISANNTSIQVDAKNGGGILTADLPRTGRTGFVDSGVTVGVTRSLQAAGEALFDVVVETTADSSLAADVSFVSEDSIVEEIGTTVPNTAQRFTRQFSRSDFDVHVEIRYVTTADPFFEDLKVDFDFEPPEMETRIADVGRSNEGLWSWVKGVWNETHPSEPAAPGEFAVGVTGADHLDMGRLTPSSYVSFESRGQPVSPSETTYGAELLNLASSIGGGLTTGPQLSHHVVAGLVAFGSWGLSIANFDNSTMTFESETVVETGNMTDLSAFDGDPGTGLAVYVDNSADAIKFIKRDAAERFVLDPSSTITNAAWPGASGRVVSAFRHASGDLLFITDGAPGEFWVLKPGQTTATRIGNAGTAPRDIRAAGNIAAIGAYGSALGFGSLSLYVRSSAGAWGLAPLSKTGSRAVGIDARLLPDGRVAVAYPSFLNNTVSITIVDNTTGEILKDETLPLPAGCTNPGHCVLVRDETVDAVLVSCNGSDNIVMMPVSFE